MELQFELTDKDVKELFTTGEVQVRYIVSFKGKIVGELYLDDPAYADVTLKEMRAR